MRSVLLQILVLAAGAMASELPWRRRAPEPVAQKAPEKLERRIRVVRIEKPPAPRPPAPKPPEKLAEAPKPAPPQLTKEKELPIRKPLTLSKSLPIRKELTKSKPLAAQPPEKPQVLAPQRIAADSTAVHGVRLRVLIPRSADDLAAHLRNSGGCLVVSRLVGGEAEVVSTVTSEGPPCSGVPRLVRDASLNAALGDPIGRARAQNPGDELVLQVLLSPSLHASTQAALRQRFGDVPDDEMGRRAAESGYELTCFAEPSGSIRCQ